MALPWDRLRQLRRDLENERTWVNQVDLSIRVASYIHERGLMTAEQASEALGRPEARMAFAVLGPGDLPWQLSRNSQHAIVQIHTLFEGFLRDLLCAGLRSTDGGTLDDIWSEWLPEGRATSLSAAARGELAGPLAATYKKGKLGELFRATAKALGLNAGERWAQRVERLDQLRHAITHNQGRATERLCKRDPERFLQRDEFLELQREDLDGVVGDIRDAGDRLARRAHERRWIDAASSVVTLAEGVLRSGPNTPPAEVCSLLARVLELSSEDPELMALVEEVMSRR